jgi:hypothetical protein
VGAYSAKKRTPAKLTWVIACRIAEAPLAFRPWLLSEPIFPAKPAQSGMRVFKDTPSPIRGYSTRFAQSKVARINHYA